MLGHRKCGRHSPLTQNSPRTWVLSCGKVYDPALGGPVARDLFYYVPFKAEVRGQLPKGHGASTGKHFRSFCLSDQYFRGIVLAGKVGGMLSPVMCNYCHSTKDWAISPRRTLHCTHSPGISIWDKHLPSSVCDANLKLLSADNCVVTRVKLAVSGFVISGAIFKSLQVGCWARKSCSH